MNAIAELRQGLSEGWKSVADGWSHLLRRASTALTPYRGARGAVQAEDDDFFPLGSPGWALLAGEVFENRNKVVVRIEAPGMEAKDFQLDVLDDRLTVRGNKRFSRESGDGRYRVFECAYGSFERTVALPAPVDAERARATYRHGVLRIELPKRDARAPRLVKVRVA